MTRIHLSPPDVGDLESAYALRALASGWVAPLGPEVDAFESELAERAGVGHALACSSGTAALHLGLLGLGVQPGDVVVVSTLTFAATAFAVSYVGAQPVFVDAAEHDGNINPVLLDRAIREARDRGENVAAVLPVDLLGKAADYSAILPIAQEHGVPVLADAAESLGARHAGRPAGSFGRAAAFSFNGNKIITTSGGGALVSDDGDLIARARYRATQAREPLPYYEHSEIGYNYRLSNVLAAIGRAQLERLDSMIERRREIRAAYADFFSTVPGASVFGHPDPDDNHWLTSVIVDPEVADWNPRDLAASLTAEGIECRPLWKPMHLQPVFAGAHAVLDGTADRLFERGITMPSGSRMTGDDLELVFDGIRRFLETGR